MWRMWRRSLGFVRCQHPYKTPWRVIWASCWRRCTVRFVKKRGNFQGFFQPIPWDVQANQVPVENVLAFGMPEPGDERKSSPFSHLFVLLHKACGKGFHGILFWFAEQVWNNLTWAWHVLPRILEALSNSRQWQKLSDLVFRDKHLSGWFS